MHFLFKFFETYKIDYKLSHRENLNKIAKITFFGHSAFKEIFN